MTLEVGLGGRQMHSDHGRTKKDNTTVKWEEPTGKTQTLSGRTPQCLHYQPITQQELGAIQRCGHAEGNLLEFKCGSV